MAKIKAVQHTSPSEQIIQDANKEYDVYDERSVRYTLRRPSFLKEMQFIEAIGESGKIEEYKIMATILSFVAKIDGIPVPKVNTKQTLEALMERVGREGFQAVSDGMMAHFFPKDLSTEEEQKDQIKK
jgi:hypothetical protein